MVSKVARIVVEQRWLRSGGWESSMDMSGWGRGGRRWTERQMAKFLTLMPSSVGTVVDAIATTSSSLVPTLSSSFTTNITRIANNGDSMS